MTKKQEIVASKLREAGIGFIEHNGTFYGDNGEFADELFGITIEDYDEWKKAVEVVGGSLEQAMEALGDPDDEIDGWCAEHAVWQEGFPIDIRCVQYEAHEGWEKTGEIKFTVVP